MATFHEIQRLAREHHLEDDPEVQQWLEKAAKLSQNDSPRVDKALRIIKQKVAEKAAQKTQQPFSEPSYTVNHWEPTLYLGETVEGSQVYVSAEQFAKHGVVLAQSGWGKTTLFRRLMLQLDNTDVNFWGFDVNTDYRHLATRSDIDLVVIPFDKLRWNLLRPPEGTPTEDWVNTVAELFADTQALLDASENFTEAQLDKLLDDYRDRFQNYRDIATDAADDLADEIDTGESPSYPTLIDLERAVDQQSYHPGDPRSSYQARVLNRLQAINRSGFHTVDCRHGHDLESLLDRNVIFEFEGKRSNVQNLFMEALYLFKLKYRQGQNHDDSQLRHVTFFDECKKLFSKFKETNSDAGVAELLDWYDRSRNYGEASLGADQEPRKLAESFLTNTYIKVLGLQTHGKQFTEAAKSMGFSDDDLQRRAAKQIDTPYGLVTVGVDGPFKVRFPDLDVTEDVTDERLVELMSETWQEYLRDGSDAVDPQSIPLSSGRVDEPEAQADAANNQQSGREQPEQLPELSEKAHRFLMDIVENPVKLTTERYDLFSSTGKASRAKKELLATEFIKEVTISKQDSQIKLLDITDRGKQYLEAKDIEVKWPGRGGIEHSYWQQRICDRLDELGYEADIEVNHRDVYGIGLDADVAVEVAMGANDREIDHIEDALADGCSRIIVACRTPEVRGFVKRKVDEQESIPAEKISVALFTEVANMDDVTDVG